MGESAETPLIDDACVVIIQMAPGLLGIAGSFLLALTGKAKRKPLQN